MPRTTRIAQGGMVFHVINRANARELIFAKEADYAACERVMSKMLARKAMRILAYLIMPNYWRLAFWPERDGDLAGFAQRLTAAMADAGEPFSAESQTRSRAGSSATRSPLRQHHPAGNGRRKTRTRIHITTSWKTKEMRLIGLFPFFHLCKRHTG